MNTSPALTASERVWGRTGLKTMNGFLPLVEPGILEDSQFSYLNELLEAMPVITKSGKEGLLAQNQFRQSTAKLADHSPVFEAWHREMQSASTPESQKNELARLLAIAFRDYQYLKMGYLFEPIHQGQPQAETELPANIANPLVLLANIFQQKPWLEYASGYVLMNSKFSDEIAADKIELIRQWHGGPDEYFFQTVHSIIEWQTPKLFQAISQLIEAREKQDIAQMAFAMQQGINVSQMMLEGLKQMTRLSRPAYYSADVRPQIQGLVGNCGEGKLFPERGVLFQSHYFEDQQPQFLNNIRGQTGAQSSIIPLLDNILGITDFYAKGDNPLTSMLREFRAYRPKPHTELLELVEQEQKRLDLRQFMKSNLPLLLAQWTHVVCQFREYHFYLAMAYIVKPGKNQPQAQSRGVGTGGSPTPKYLPQHVSESIEALMDVLAEIDQQSFSQIEQGVIQSLHDYANRTHGENHHRSSVVDQYLQGKAQQQVLDEAIQKSHDKMEPEVVLD